MVETLLKELLKPIGSAIVSFIKNEKEALEFEDNMRRLLESNYTSRMAVKNILYKGKGFHTEEILIYRN